MSKTPYNAGKVVEVVNEHHGPNGTIDFSKITIVENWGRLFIRKGDQEIMVNISAYPALRDAIDCFIEPDPRDAVIERLTTMAENAVDVYRNGGDALAIDRAMTALSAAAKGGVA